MPPAVLKRRPTAITFGATTQKVPNGNRQCRAVPLLRPRCSLNLSDIACRLTTAVWVIKSCPVVVLVCRFSRASSKIGIHVSDRSFLMKAAIHPAYEEVRVHCACGNTFSTRSTHRGDISVEICSACHPFFTGKQKLLDTAGRVERFRRKYANVPAAAGKK